MNVPSSFYAVWSAGSITGALFVSVCVVRNVALRQSLLITAGSLLVVELAAGPGLLDTREAETGLAEAAQHESGTSGSVAMRARHIFRGGRGSCSTGRVSNSPVTVDRAGLWDAEALSDVAAATFPLACPPGATADDIEIFITDALSGERFGEYLSDPSRTVLKAVAGDDIVGYAMLHAGDPADPEVATAIELRPVVEISKMYVLPGHHGTGVSTALMHGALERARADGFAGVWLGVNQENTRAQRFYTKHGFQRVGTRIFLVGQQLQHDFVLRLVF